MTTDADLRALAGITRYTSGSTVSDNNAWRDWRNAATPIRILALLDRLAAAEARSMVLNVERLREAIYAVSVRHDWATTTDTEDRTEEFAAEYVRLSKEPTE